MLPIFVISLTTATARRQHISQEFGKQGIDFEFFDAKTPADLADFNQILPSNVLNSNLGMGEKACFLSHICLWQKMIDKGIDYLTIFEDDVYLGDDASLFLQNYLSDHYLNTYNIHLLKLETFFIKTHLQNPINLHTRKIGKLTRDHLGMAGYIISQKMAKDMLIFLQKIPSQNILPIDRHLFEDMIHITPVHQLSPALCVQAFMLGKEDTLPSQLKDSRAPYAKPSANLMQKIGRECKKAIIKTHTLFYPVIDFR